MTSRSVSESASQAPRVHVRPRAAKTYGDLAADFASDYGLRPDPWQQIVLDDWLAEKSGRWASLTCGLSVPRQNGKNALIEVRELFGMVGRGEKFLHTAHEVKTARKAFKRLQHFFGTKAEDPGARYPELNARVADVRNVNGQEAIFLTNGGSVEVVARSKNSARGFTVDVLVMDEAQEMSEDDLEALMPTTSSSPLRNPQWIFTGTPPGPNANGEIFTRVRGEALSGKSVRLAWHEWSAESKASLDDRDEWRKVNPALINGRLQFEVIEGERANLSPEGFRRERLGVWDETPSSGRVFDPSRWAACANKDREQPPPAAVALAGSVDGLWSSIGAAAVVGDVTVVGAVDRRPGQDWVVAEAKRIQDEHRCVVAVDKRGPLSHLIPMLEDAGVRVETLDTAAYLDACASFWQGVNERTVSHPGHPELDAAATAATWRTVGDRRAFGRKAGEISMLEACTIAATVASVANYSVLDSVW